VCMGGDGLFGVSMHVLTERGGKDGRDKFIIMAAVYVYYFWQRFRF